MNMKKVRRFEKMALVAMALALPATSLWAVDSKTGVAKPPTSTTQAATRAEAAVNVNTASAEQLASGLDGVGPAKAQAIIAYRETNGPFKDEAQLLNVKGIGEAILKQNEGKIAF
ncbi:MAG: ComEA family DNA-binding protein [Gammaproteobacteria bacterium]|jgi:competence protein ComEA